MRLVSVAAVAVADPNESYRIIGGVEVRQPRNIRVAMTLIVEPAEKSLLLGSKIERFSFVHLRGSRSLEAVFVTDDTKAYIGLLVHPGDLHRFATERVEDLEEFALKHS